jgi:hypothetical protein
MVDSKIFKTQDYEQFVVYEEFHRPTTDKQLDKLERKILRENKLQDWPIWITEKMEIVDGRHRFSIAKKHNLVIYYIFQYESKDYHSWILKKFGMVIDK